jgi:ubiquinone/menaquinone biosynthesis C-methylase UbiE
MTWEEAVKELRSNPENAKVIADNYFDENIDEAIERFRSSEEFLAVMKYIPASAKTLLDIGAGRGMATYGFASNGLLSTALEPDPSDDVGAGAIRKLATRHGLPITVVETFGESLPFDDGSFDVVYVRQVLHHATDLAIFCKEVNRVLKPGGLFVATREHVLTQDSDLQTFLDNHLLHHLYGGEHAYTLAFYLKCIRQSGLTIKHLLHPYASVINYAPLSITEMKENFERKLSSLTGKRLAGYLLNIPVLYRLLTTIKARQDQSPGRLYSFICTKPV